MVGLCMYVWMDGWMDSRRRTNTKHTIVHRRLENLVEDESRCSDLDWGLLVPGFTGEFTRLASSLVGLFGPATKEIQTSNRSVRRRSAGDSAVYTFSELGFAGSVLINVTLRGIALLRKETRTVLPGTESARTAFTGELTNKRSLGATAIFERIVGRYALQ